MVSNLIYERFFVTFGAKIKANQLNINWLALLFRIFFRNLKC